MNFYIPDMENANSTRKASTSARVWDRAARGYAAKPVADSQSYERKLAITREYLCASAGVLELGCGTGSTALEHADYARYIRAVDFSIQMIEIAREKAREAAVDNVNFVRNDVVDEFSSITKYDMVLALNLLHLLADWGGAIQSAHRLLKPGGVFVTSTACLSDNFDFMRFLAALGHRLGALPQLSFFTHDDLHRAISEAGFEIERSWQPSPKAGVFIVARKSGDADRAQRSCVHS